MGLENEIYMQYHVDCDETNNTPSVIDTNQFIATLFIKNVRIQILEEEIRYYRTLIEEHDCGHIYTTINFLQQRVEHLAGKKEWPFYKE